MKKRARENKPRCAIEVRVYTCVWHRKNVSGSCTRPCLPIINGKRAAPKIKFGYWRVDSTSPKTSKGPRNGGNDAGPPDGPSQKEAVKKVNHFSFFLSLLTFFSTWCTSRDTCTPPCLSLFFFFLYSIHFVLAFLETESKSRVRVWENTETFHQQLTKSPSLFKSYKDQCYSLSLLLGRRLNNHKNLHRPMEQNEDTHTHWGWGGGGHRKKGKRKSAHPSTRFMSLLLLLLLAFISSSGQRWRRGITPWSFPNRRLTVRPPTWTETAYRIMLSSFITLQHTDWMYIQQTIWWFWYQKGLKKKLWQNFTGAVSDWKVIIAQDEIGNVYQVAVFSFFLKIK